MKVLVSRILKSVAKSVGESAVGRSIPFSAHAVEIPSVIVKKAIHKNIVKNS